MPLTRWYLPTPPSRQPARDGRPFALITLERERERDQRGPSVQPRLARLSGPGSIRSEVRKIGDRPHRTRACGTCVCVCAFSCNQRACDRVGEWRWFGGWSHERRPGPSMSRPATTVAATTSTTLTTTITTPLPWSDADPLAPTPTDKWSRTGGILVLPGRSEQDNKVRVVTLAEVRHWPPLYVIPRPLVLFNEVKT